MKKIIFLIVVALVSAVTVPVLAQTTNAPPSTTGTNGSSPTIVVTDVTPPAPPVTVVHRVAVPPSISVTLAPALLAQLDPQHPAGKVVSRLTIVGNANGSFTATITYVNPRSN